MFFRIFIGVYIWIFLSYGNWIFERGDDFGIGEIMLFKKVYVVFVKLCRMLFLF